MKVRLWGTRGSLASPGPETVRYGGNTSCVEVRGRDGTLLILDAGTGIQALGGAIEADVSEVHLLLTHLHMDHLQGLGFFKPLFRDDTVVHIWGPISSTKHLRDRLSLYMSPPLFPVRLRDLPCLVAIHDVTGGRFRAGEFDVCAELVCHPGPTLGYRIEEGAASLAYLPDHEPALGSRTFPQEPRWTSGFALMEGVSCLVHDAQYSLEEYPGHVGWGHSSIDHTVALARMARVERLVTFHHDPAHSDAMLDELHDYHAEQPFALIGGQEGLELELD